ncbi:two-component system regulatory protein YycI [Planococcus salinus]|uniref:Regulatory protein YycH-like domain-containing protein n=1 Tax=Planococcus salinus TaxID=1848460 RepID=A0A3M8P8C4_9BACL|nr:two-component system regulatory protein YycI [Planococcus salinus]RNF39913.1 hypothetical protein EEX84_08105 [Planococcus salinus]
MDWSKTKTIFIIVFSILNIFLYLLYVERYTESEKVGILGDATIEEKLKADTIAYPELPEEVDQEPYVLGTAKVFETKDIATEGIQVRITDDTKLTVTLNSPLALNEVEEGEPVEEFVSEHVYEGEEYVLWNVDEEKNEAIFFQEINDKTLYHSDSGKLVLHWNEDEEVTHYEQTIFEEITPQELLKDVIPPMQALQTLYQRTMLPSDSEIDFVTLGYSAHVRISDGTQMFLPTWRVKVTLEDGSSENYFVNAFKDGVLELEKDEEDNDEEQ